MSLTFFDHEIKNRDVNLKFDIASVVPYLLLRVNDLAGASLYRLNQKKILFNISLAFFKLSNKIMPMM